jgi:acetyl-CoA C-acetyltransferase
MNIYIKGAATTKFGELWNSSLRDLGNEALEESIIDSKIPKNKIEALFIGNMLSGILGGQEHLGPLFTRTIGLNIPAFHIEGACASGGLALNTAINSILSGRYETVAVLGVEKMTDYKTEIVAKGLMGAASEEERDSGVTFPGLYAILERAYMDKFGLTEKDLAEIPVKSHFYANLNPNAQFHSLISVADVMKSPYVSDPIKLLECSPVSDGASAVIITSRKSKNDVEILASEVATDSLSITERKSLTCLMATKIAAKNAYKKANISPSEINIAEIHDCFSIAQILAVQDLGLTQKTVINTSGGLKGAGHPVGATGIKQIVEIVDQLKNRTGKRQIKNAKLGLTQNVGGSGATSVIHILKI